MVPWYYGIYDRTTGRPQRSDTQINGQTMLMLLSVECPRKDNEREHGILFQKDRHSFHANTMATKKDPVENPLTLKALTDRIPDFNMANIFKKEVDPPSSVRFQAFHAELRDTFKLNIGQQDVDAVRFVVRCTCHS